MIELNDFLVKGEKWLYDSLAKYKQDVLPDDFRLQIDYRNDTYHDQNAGQALIQLHKTLTQLDFPFFFVEIVTTNNNIQKELEHCTQNYSNETDCLKYKIVSGEFNRSYPKYDSKCVLPWIHYYINPQGQVGPCCMFDERFPQGNVNTQGTENIDSMLEGVRQYMLAGKRHNTCSTCWKKEDAGLKSARQYANHRWANYKESTDVVLRHLDIRISNKCNFMCRMCSGKFSNRIAQEERKLYGNTKYFDEQIETTLEDKIFDLVVKNVDTLEEVYFAGGEPLINDFHYKVLNYLREQGRQDIRIRYNTNLSIIKYKNYDLLDYWSWFNNVTVGASLDLIGAPANYVRHGAEYDTLEQNYYHIRDFVNFTITSTLHLMNAYNLPKLHNHWSNIIPSPKIRFSILVNPSEQQLTVLPKVYKQELTEMYNSMSDQWQEAARFMNSRDDSHLLKEFFRLNDDKDRARNQTFEDYFNEYKDLRSFVSIQ